MAMGAGPTIIIGVGNPDRGDDAAGREVARRLRGACAGDVDVAELDGEATALLAKLETAEAAFVIDACVSGAPPGTIRRVDVAETPLCGAAFGLSSHGFGLAEALALAATLGVLPRRCVVYAIEGRRFDIGAPVSDAVARAIEEVVERLRLEVASLDGEGHA
jgi:hydrogenase maturation protease